MFFLTLFVLSRSCSSHLSCSVLLCHIFHESVLLHCFLDISPDQKKYKNSEILKGKAETCAKCTVQHCNGLSKLNLPPICALYEGVLSPHDDESMTGLMTGAEELPAHPGQGHCTPWLLVSFALKSYFLGHL